MVLVDLQLTNGVHPLTSKAERVVAEGEAQIQRYLDLGSDHDRCRIGRSDFNQVWGALSQIKASRSSHRLTFCEWGSGFGVNTCLASELGYRSVGIELDVDLVRRAQRLAEQFELEASFVVGNFIPEGGTRFIEPTDDIWLTQTIGRSAYSQEGMLLSAFDVIFAYPAPGEGRFFADLIDQFTQPGTVFISFHGGGELRIRQHN